MASLVWGAAHQHVCMRTSPSTREVWAHSCHCARINALKRWCRPTVSGGMEWVDSSLDNPSKEPLATSPPICSAVGFCILWFSVSAANSDRIDRTVCSPVSFRLVADSLRCRRLPLCSCWLKYIRLRTGWLPASWYLRRVHRSRGVLGLVRVVRSN
jgi:hypothetical protein